MKKHTKYTVAVTLAILATTLPSHASTLAAVLADDTCVIQGSPTFNYGASPNLHLIGTSNAHRWTYLKFDLTYLKYDPVTKVSTPASLSEVVKPEDIESAEVRIFVNNVTAAGSFAVYTVQASWIEGSKAGAASVPAAAPTELNWNNKPASDAVQEGLTAVGVPTVYSLAATDEREFKRLDVTELVKDWMTSPNPAANFGIVLKPIGTTVSATFDSKEQTTTGNRPSLVITLVKKRTPARGDLSMGTFTNPAP